MCYQAAEEEVAAPAKKEKTHFTVKLTALNAADKVKLIKEVKNSMQGLNLVQVSPLNAPHCTPYIWIYIARKCVL